MKQKSLDQPQPLPLWQQAELSAQDGHELAEPPLAAECVQLNELMDKHPGHIEHRQMGGDEVDLTPTARFIVLKKTPEGTVGTPANSDDIYSVTLLPEDTGFPGSSVAQAHRLRNSRELYLALAFGNGSEIRQYTIHDGHATDVADKDRTLGEDEAATIEGALSALAQKISAEFEAVDRERVARKIGAWWAGRDERRIRRANDRKLMRQIRAMGPD